MKDNQENIQHSIMTKHTLIYQKMKHPCENAHKALVLIGTSGQKNLLLNSNLLAKLNPLSVIIDKPSIQNTFNPNSSYYQFSYKNRHTEYISMANFLFAAKRSWSINFGQRSSDYYHLVMFVQKPNLQRQHSQLLPNQGSVYCYFFITETKK